MDVPGYTPPLPVMTVAPVLVSVVAASAPNDLPAPIAMGPQARFSKPGFSAVGAAREKELKELANKAKAASLLMLKIVDFMVNDLLSLA